MLQDIKDEVLSGQPLYTIKNSSGNVLNDNVDISLKTPITQEGTPVNRALFRNLQGDLYTSDRYNTPTYSGNAMTLNLPLTTYEAGKVVKITAPATLTNPTLNVNDLGEKTINGTIESGYKYVLIYNGTSFDKIAVNLPIPQAQIITASGTYTFLAKRYIVIVVGGGGGGGDVDHYYTSDNYAGSGGGGGIAIGIYISDGTPINITIGAGGSAGGREASGLNGGTTIFGGIKAYGGKGGTGGHRDSSANPSGDGGTAENLGLNPAMLGNSLFWTTQGGTGVKGSTKNHMGRGGYGYYGIEGNFGQGGRGTSWPTKNDHYSNTAGASGAVILYPIGERRE